MSTLAISGTPAMPQLATSGDGVLRHVHNMVVFLGSGLATQSTTTATSNGPRLEFISSAQTNSGLSLQSSATSQAAAIAELRRRSGCTWEQLARLFGVARRSVHFWASGKPMNAANEERLNELLRTIRYIDRGGSGATRSALMSAQPDGAIPFELLADGRFDDVMGRLGQGSGYDGGRPSRISDTLVPLFSPPPPDQLVGALHDTVSTTPRPARAGRSAKVKKKP